MPETKRFEQQFFNALRDIFVGAKIEGDSGFINLMSIKSRYYEQGVFPRLQQEINHALTPFPAFREELFDKLYTFFQRYFSESGSIYFRYTSLNQKVYEKVYTDDRDVILFWKTHMLYYVKTDRIFNSLQVEVDGVKFFFNASGMTLKKSNEKREVIFSFKEVDPLGTLVFDVAYTERGKVTRYDDILIALKKLGKPLSDETLRNAFRVFEKQSEVDYFINKDARAFLEEQFDLWLYQYLFDGQNVWTETRLAQLQALKSVAYKIIAFIAQFEDELVKIWNKPKFVRNSHYVITLDKLIDTPVFEKILVHPAIQEQVQEWRDLGMIDEQFKIEMLTEKDLAGGRVHPQYQYLSIDTRYFPDLELDILGLFEDLDAALDGWLIHSENYQALNSISDRFSEKVGAIYIDPPYNSDSSEIIYANNYKSSSWLSILESRLRISKKLLMPNGFCCVAIDDFEYSNLYNLLETIFTITGKVVVRSNPAGRSTSKGFSINHEYAIFSTISDYANIGFIERNQDQIDRYKEEDEKGKYEWVNFRKHGGLRAESPRMYYPIYISSKGNIRLPEMMYNEISKEWEIQSSLKRNETVLYPIDANGQDRRWKWSVERFKDAKNERKVDNDKDGKLAIYIKSRMPGKGILPGTWWDDKEFSATDWGAKTLKDLFGSHGSFSYPKAPKLVEKCIEVMSQGDQDLFLDYFAGSGTTAHAVMNLNREDGGKRKYILIEMGDHFNTVIIPRIKKVAFSNEWKAGKPDGGQGMGHFVKYYDLEQYEDVLKKARYADSSLLDNPYADPFHQYVFLKDARMLDALEIDTVGNAVHLHPERIYPDIDLAETLSQRAGKWIKRITREYVEFEDGERQSLLDPDWKLLKPLIWW